MAKKKSKKAKKKELKKQKLRSKRSPSATSSSSSSCSTASHSNKAYQWEEAATAAAAAPASSRSDWFAGISAEAMEANIFLGSATSSKIRAAEKERLARETAQQAAGLIINSGESGSAQQQQQEGLAQAPAPPPPHNTDWYRRAYRRCQEQSKEQGRPLEDVAAERWGSLDRLRSLMAGGDGDSGRGGGQPPRWKRRDEAGGRRSETEGRRSQAAWRRPDSDDRRSETEGQRSEAAWRRSESDDKRSETEGRRSETEGRRSQAAWRRPDSDDRRSETEGRRSEAAWRRPDSDDRRSEAAWRRSESDDRRSETEGRRSEAAWRRPDSDDRRSETEGRRSEAAWRRPESDDRRSEAAWRRSESDDRRSEIEGRRSENDNRRSETESRRSEVAWRRPESDDRRSEAESVRSKTGSQRPVAEDRRPEAESRRSESDARGSEGSEGSRPRPEGTREPRAETAAPQPAAMLEEERHVRQDDVNQLSAQILRAQLAGEAAKAGKLERRLAVMREAQRRGLKVRIKQRAPQQPQQPHQQPQLHQQPPRQKRPGPRDLGASASLAEMAAHERLIDARAMQLDFAGAYRPDDEDDEAGGADEAAASKRAKKERQLDKAADRERALGAEKFRASGRRCDLCLEATAGGKLDREAERQRRSLIVESGSRVYLRLPAVRSLVDKHCQLSCIGHVACCAELEDDAFEELAAMKRKLVQRLAGVGLDCVFVEVAKALRRQPHLLVEAFPLAREVAESAPIYFKKALMEAGPEWASNRKAVPLRDLDIRRTVPRGFPYLAVEFGRDSGLVHVIEDEAAFPGHFGREVLAGMLDLSHELWRRPKPDSWEALLAKVSEFRFFWSGSGEAVVSGD